MDYLNKAAADIKSLKIQGATNLAKSAVDALIKTAKKSRTKTKEAFVKELKHAKDILYKTRPNEPLMRNALRYIVFVAINSAFSDVKMLKSLVERTGKEFIENSKKEKNEIAKIGANKISNGMVILTHCHSSTVVNIFREAKKQGKKFSVICTETRPLYQGHRTARELVAAKIPTTMVVDTAVSSLIKEVDLVIVGADVVTSDISLVNKVGTLYVALAAKRAGIQFYSAAELAKFDPETLFGKTEEIEQRPAKEVWDKPPKGLKIRNPAFDIVPSELVSAFITSEGIISPGSFMETVREKRGWIFKGF